VIEEGRVAVAPTMPAERATVAVAETLSFDYSIVINITMDKYCL
jgi:hypothetical protein